MKLLFVSHSLPPYGRPQENIGGMQRAAMDLHDGFIASKSVEVIPLVLRSAWSERGIRTPLFLGKALRQIRRMAARKEMDAVLFSSMVTAMLAIPLGRQLRRNGIVSASIVNGLDATTPTWPYPAMVRKAFASVDLILPISNATKNACMDRGLDESKAKVISLGIRLDRFAAATDKQAARHRMLKMFGIDDAPALVLCSVGRLVPRKGVEWLVANVMTKLPPDVMLLVVGEGPERQKIQSAIDDNALWRQVHLLGAVSDAQLETVCQGSDIFVMPNVKVPHDMEGFGLVMLEAGLIGLPVIASNIEGIADVITPGENGDLVESGHADGFREAVMKYYVDPQRLKTDSQRARMHVVSRFGWTGVIQRYLDELAELMGRRANRRTG